MSNQDEILNMDDLSGGDSSDAPMLLNDAGSSSEEAGTGKKKKKRFGSSKEKRPKSSREPSPLMKKLKKLPKPVKLLVVLLVVCAAIVMSLPEPKNTGKVKFNAEAMKEAKALLAGKSAPAPKTSPTTPSKLVKPIIADAGADSSAAKEALQKAYAADRTAITIASAAPKKVAVASAVSTPPSGLTPPKISEEKGAPLSGVLATAVASSEGAVNVSSGNVSVSVGGAPKTGLTPPKIAQNVKATPLTGVLSTAVSSTDGAVQVSTGSGKVNVAVSTGSSEKPAVLVAVSQPAEKTAEMISLQKAPEKAVSVVVNAPAQSAAVVPQKSAEVIQKAPAQAKVTPETLMQTAKSTPKVQLPAPVLAPMPTPNLSSLVKSPTPADLRAISRSELQQRIAVKQPQKKLEAMLPPPAPAAKTQETPSSIAESSQANFTELVSVQMEKLRQSMLSVGDCQDTGTLEKNGKTWALMMCNGRVYEVQMN